LRRWLFVAGRRPLKPMIGLKIIVGLTEHDPPLGGDKSFETSLRLILKDPSGQMLEQIRLKPVRHGGYSIFFLLPVWQRHREDSDD